MKDNARSAGVGDNHVDAGALLAFIERVERLDEERKGIVDDIKDVYAEAKGKGYDPKVMRLIVKRRARDKDIVRAEDEMMDTYLAALGMI